MISVRSDLHLICPECGEDQSIPQKQLALGRRVRCGHCGVESYLNHCRESADDPAEWCLKSALMEEEDRGVG